MKAGGGDKKSGTQLVADPIENVEATNEPFSGCKFAPFLDELLTAVIGGGNQRTIQP